MNSRREGWSKMDDLREGLCIEKCLIEILVKSRIIWVGHVENGQDCLLTQVHQENPV